MIVKQTDAELSQEQREVLAGVLFQMFAGATAQDDRFWKRTWRALMAAAAGEMFALRLELLKDGAYHRRHMALEQKLFDSQEQFYVFNQFRNWLKVGAGFVEWRVVRGQLVPQPLSISYDECDQFTMEQFHSDAAAFLRSRRAQAELWPHLTPLKAQEMMESILEGFGE